MLKFSGSSYSIEGRMFDLIGFDRGLIEPHAMYSDNSHKVSHRQKITHNETIYPQVLFITKAGIDLKPSLSIRRIAQILI